MNRIMIILQLISLVSLLSGGYFLGQLDAWSARQPGMIIITGTVG